MPRYSFLALVELTDSASTMCIVARVNEISRKGCYVYTQDTLAVNTTLKIVISRDDQTFVSSGKVIYAHDRVGMGIVFVGSAEDQLEILNSWFEGLATSYAL